RRMTAREAHHFGLVSRVCEGGELLNVARDLATQIADAAPLSVQAIKQVVKGIEGMPIPQAFEAIKSGRFPLYDIMLASEDHVEGPRAFAEKRKPVFRGR